MKDASWYYNQDLKPQGPISLEEMRLRIGRGEVGPHDLICNDSDDSWKPADEVFERNLFPANQAIVPGQVFSEEEKEWVLLVPSVDGKGVLQEGPFSVRDLREGLVNGTISDMQYVWKTGLSGWCHLKDRPEFSEVFSSRHP